jgi:hypothetical protein
LSSRGSATELLRDRSHCPCQEAQEQNVKADQRALFKPARMRFVAPLLPRSPEPIEKVHDRHS